MFVHLISSSSVPSIEPSTSRDAVTSYKVGDRDDPLERMSRMNSGCAAVSDTQQRTDRNMMEAVERIKPLQLLTTIGRFSVAMTQDGAL